MEQRLSSALAAAKWLGTKEGSSGHLEILRLYNSLDPLPRGYRMRETDAWCAAFVSAVAVEAGVDALVPVECSCTRIIEKAKEMGIWEEDESQTPKIGDWVLYNWDAKASGDDQGSPDHVGIVIGVEGELLVVEGNYDNAVKLRRVPLDWGKLRGFVCPRYEEESMRYDRLEEVPEYARPTIEKLCADGSLRGVAQDALGLTGEMIRILVILDRRGIL